MAEEAGINTKAVEGRRAIKYASIDDWAADVESCAASKVRTLGNWSQGQIYQHLADSLNVSIDGARLMPAPVRFLLSLFLKKRLLNRSIPAGFTAPAGFVPGATELDEGLAALREAFIRQRETTERAPHPGFGKITREEWDKFHLRHAEMHMSFIVSTE